MSTDLESAIETLNNYEGMSNKLVHIKSIGHSACIKSLCTYSNFKLKELGLVTAGYTKVIDLYHPQGRVRTLWQIISRNLRVRIPYLAPMEAEFIKVRNDHLSIHPHPSPRVERYLRRMGRKLSILTKGTYELTSRHDYDIDREIWILKYCEVIPYTSNRIYAFSILEMLEDILQVLATLHREMCIRDNILPDEFFLRDESMQPVEVVPVQPVPVQPVVETVTVLGDTNE